MFERDGNTWGMHNTDVRVASEPGRRYVVTFGHSELVAVVTIMLWFMAAIGFALIDLPPGGLASLDAPRTAADTGLLAGVDPAYALACGIALFGVRVVLHFESIGVHDPSPVKVDDDPVLRDIVRKLDGDAPPKQGRRKPRRSRPARNR